jgi:arylsulfatase
MDILRTVLELAGIQHPDTAFRGRSWLKLLAAHDDTSTEIYTDSSLIVGWKQLATAAVRKGDWKAAFLSPPRGQSEWELFKLANGLGETHELTTEMPEKMAEMIAHYDTYYQETGMFDSCAMFQEEAQKLGIKGS